MRLTHLNKGKKQFNFYRGSVTASTPGTSVFAVTLTGGFAPPQELGKKGKVKKVKMVK